MTPAVTRFFTLTSSTYSVECGDMQAPRVTRSSVLGKRVHQQEPSIATPTKSCDVQLPTPDSTPSPKRARTSIDCYDGDSNKENVPPISSEAAGLDTLPSSSRSVRPIRRTATELSSPSRPRSSK